MLSLWLPLNGNTTQQGISGSTVSNVTATVDNSGKIGKCYSFSGSQHVAIPEVIIPSNTTAWSFACWFYLANTTSSSAACLFSERTGGNAAGYTIFIYPNNSSMLVDDGARWQVTPMTFTVQTWYHLVVTRDSTGKKIYINGELKSSTTTIGTTTSINSNGCLIGKAQNSTALTSGDQGFIGKLNDVRVYVDHALSPKEVEILSRGLVCHYPLTGGGRGGDNLLKNTADLTLWSKEAGITTTWDSEKNMYKIEDSAHTNSRWGIYQDINVEANTSYTITVTLDGTACGAGFAVYDSSTSFPPAVISTTGRQSYTLTSGANSTKARVYLYTHCGVGKVAWFSLPKVEKGDKSTLWIPNSADTEYTKMGYDSITEYDVSGYGNNMTKIGTITYTSDSVRYSVASHFINGSYLRADQNSSEYLPKDSLTVNLWVKPTTWSNPISCTEGGGWNFEGYSVQFPCYISGVGYKVAASNVTGASLQDGKWHMLTGTYDRIAQEVKIYIDGVLKATTATGSSNNIGYASNRLIISGEAEGITPNHSSFVGEESDVRIYATALSATQVAELYNTAVSVANNGTLMGYELVEV